MATFTYEAKTRTGDKINGVLTAENTQAALRMLDERALFPVWVREGGQAAKTLTGQKRKIKLSVLTTFYSQFADLLKAGVPVLRSLDVLARQESNPLLTEVLRELHSDVSSGETLADAMAKHPNVFSELSVSMVRAGEQGGFLEDVLLRIATFTERQDELRNKLVGSMIYPVLLLFIGCSVVVALMIFVVPKIKAFIDRVEKPWLTDALFAFSDFLVHQWFYLLLILLVAGFALSVVLRSERGQMFWQRMQFKVPVMGKIVQMVSICRFCRILGTLLHNGVPMLQSLQISKESAGNRILADEIERASESVQQGSSLAEQLGQSGLFPTDIVDMIAVAEESNNLENVLIQIADSNEVRTARQIDLGVRLLEPLMLVVMASFVAVIAIALLVPILRMSTSMH